MEHDWPLIVLRGNALVAHGVAEVAVATLVRNSIRELFDEDLSIVAKFIVADSDLYGEAIREELDGQSGPTHTETVQYQGVGKTIPRRTSDGKVKNAIIVRAGVVAAALEKDGVEPLMPPYLGKHILQHELAHCYDHVLRQRPDPVGLTDHGEFSINRIGVYYKRILLDEFAACALSGSVLTDEAFNFLCYSDGEPLGEMLRRVFDLRHTYLTRQTDDLRTVAFESSQCFWLILVQYTKMTGHIFGLGRAAEPVHVAFPQELASSPDAMLVLKQLWTFLATKVGDYPNWPEDGWDELDGFWDQLARSFGFRFEETESGSALWFD